MTTLSFRSALLLVAICIAVVAAVGIAVGNAVVAEGKANAARVDAVMEGMQ